VIAPWIHHSLVKSASLEWECIPNLASPCKITLQNLSALPQQDSTSQETTGHQEWWNDSPALVCSGSWLICAWLKLEESTLKWDKWTAFHCNVLSLRVCICCYSSHPSLRHRFGKNHPHWLDSQWKVYISSLLSLLGSMYNYCLLLLIWSPFMVPEPSPCDLCMHTTQAKKVVIRTLLFHIYGSCAGSVIGSHMHNHTTYLVCFHGNQHICFNPTYRPLEQWLEIRSIRNPGSLVSLTQW
jgi:hypothetical protein